MPWDGIEWTVDIEERWVRCLCSSRTVYKHGKKEVLVISNQ